MMDWIKNNGYAFSTGYPNKDNVMPGHKKVGWEEVFDLNVYTIPINTENISKIYSKNKIKQKALKFALIVYTKLRKYKLLSKDMKANLSIAPRSTPRSQPRLYQVCKRI